MTTIHIHLATLLARRAIRYHNNTRKTKVVVCDVMRKPEPSPAIAGLMAI